MINRREVLASGLTISLLGPAAAAFGTATQHRTSREPLALFAADDRLAHARAAARAAARAGAAIIFTDADVTPLYATLDRRWRVAQLATAGVTTVSTLFAIERLALDRGLRGAYRGMHRDTGSRVEHEMLGPPALLRRIAEGSVPAATDFAANLGRALVGWAPEVDEPGRALPALRPPGSADGSTAFASWLFVPKRA